MNVKEGIASPNDFALFFLYCYVSINMSEVTDRQFTDKYIIFILSNDWFSNDVWYWQNTL